MEARISQLEARLNIVEARPTALTVEAVAPQLELASDPPVAPEQPGNQGKWVTVRGRKRSAKPKPPVSHRPVNVPFSPHSVTRRLRKRA